MAWQSFQKGDVIDQIDELIGHVNQEGRITDWASRLREDGHALDHGGRDVGYIVDMPLLPAGAAAILLLILRVVRTGSIERGR